MVEISFNFFNLYLQSNNRSFLGRSLCKASVKSSRVDELIDLYTSWLHDTPAEEYDTLVKGVSKSGLLAILDSDSSVLPKGVFNSLFAIKIVLLMPYVRFSATYSIYFLWRCS